MMTRRDAIGLLSGMSVGALFSPRDGVASSRAAEPGARSRQADVTPPLAPGDPTSPERLALITAFRERSAGIDEKFEARSHRSDWVMPYRLFRPEVTGRLPLVLYLHGGGGLGNDNVKQMATGNIFGARLWALPENQQAFPCYVVAPQTDRGWVRYGPPRAGDSVATVVPGLGDGARLALEIVDALRREFAIDDQRIYVTGQSMGGAGVWQLTAYRSRLFAAAVVCCGTASRDDAARSIGTPLWNFHGDTDQVVPVAVSRDRIAEMRRAGGHPLHTEYAGVGHNVWQWAYTEPALVRWMFSHQRRR